MTFARINGTVLHYRLSGPQGAPALVFVNSLGTDARIWDEVIALLSQTYLCLSYDKRGHGISDVPVGDYSLDDHLDDLSGLLDHTGIDGAVLVGVSIGGIIAEGMALRAPHRVHGLVLCCTAPRMGDAPMWTARIETVRGAGLGAMVDAIMERWFSPTFRAERTEELGGWRNLFLRTDPEGYANTCATLRDTDLTDAISAIAAPTLIVGGDADLAAPLDLVRNGLAIPGSRLEVLPGVGHIPSIEQPAILGRLIDDFLKEVGHG
ncbi:3-oxoadipate enol-lactonase [Devosia lucknowensis]|uniref:3-oxoadipate enol-lactonase n=1 Tax=Devosia lucknowensis TaxID=1096929 RepID=A0A1Y6GA79_9HYPH|nr:3-oxoadipate enol-lactonase [Devosia lucknowensis]SMQ85327.1 3-oxoadipate enol-lactonase [Devosia lucknowensis]